MDQAHPQKPPRHGTAKLRRLALDVNPQSGQFRVYVITLTAYCAAPVPVPVSGTSTSRTNPETSSPVGVASSTSRATADAVAAGTVVSSVSRTRPASRMSVIDDDPSRFDLDPALRRVQRRHRPRRAGVR